MNAGWWILTGFLLFWIAGVTALFLHMRDKIKSAKERGWYDNGLGTRISAADNPTNFRLLLFGWKFMTFVGALFIAGGLLALLIRIAQAL